MILLPYSFPLVQNATREAVDLIFLAWEAGSARTHLGARSQQAVCCPAGCVVCLGAQTRACSRPFSLDLGTSLGRSLSFQLEKPDDFLIFKGCIHNVTGCNWFFHHEELRCFAFISELTLQSLAATLFFFSCCL